MHQHMWQTTNLFNHYNAVYYNVDCNIASNHNHCSSDVTAKTESFHVWTEIASNISNTELDQQVHIFAFVKI